MCGHCLPARSSVLHPLLQLGAASRCWGPLGEGGACNPSGSWHRDGGERCRAMPCHATGVGRRFPSAWVCWPAPGRLLVPGRAPCRASGILEQQLQQKSTVTAAAENHRLCCLGLPPPCLPPGEAFVTLNVARNSTKQLLDLSGMPWDAYAQSMANS